MQSENYLFSGLLATLIEIRYDGASLWGNQMRKNQTIKKDREQI